MNYTSEWNIKLGPPGTGKTTDLMTTLEQELQAGVRPEKIGLTSFTVKAIDEAKDRAKARFGIGDHRLQYFRTIHSLAFRQIGMRHDRVMQPSHYREVGQALGIDIRGNQSLDGTDYGMAKGDRMLFLVGLARSSQRPLKDVWSEAGEIDINWAEIDRLDRSLKTYKDNKNLMDFTDMLEAFVSGQHPVPALEVLIVDEAQDLSALQWKVVEMLAAKAQRVYVAGDDDQAIYRWSGADVDTFMALRGKRNVLGQSFRVPARVHEVAARIVARIKHRAPKEWQPRTEPGTVARIADAAQVDMSKGTWLLLARNGYLLDGLEDLCRKAGYAYESAGKNPMNSPAAKAAASWEQMRRGGHITKREAENLLRFISHARISQEQRDKLRQLSDKAQIILASKDSPGWDKALDRMPDDDRCYFAAVHKRGEKMMRPRINISTIHRAKGGEAENVLLLTDMSERTFKEMQRKPDDEHRCWYVAVTRAKQNLYLVNPTNAMQAYQVMG